MPDADAPANDDKPTTVTTPAPEPKGNGAATEAEKRAAGPEELSPFDARIAAEATKKTAYAAMMERVNKRAAELKGEKAPGAAKPAEKPAAKDLPRSSNGTFASAANDSPDGKTTEKPAEEKKTEKPTPAAAHPSRAKQRIMTLAREKAELEAEVAKLKAAPAPIAPAPAAATDDDVKARIKARPALAFEAGLDLKTLADEWIANNPAPGEDATRAEKREHQAKLDKAVEDLAAKKVAALEEENAKLREKVTAGEAKTAEIEARERNQKAIDHVVSVISPDKDRWEICNRVSEAPMAILADARSLVAKAIAGDIDICEKFDISEEEIARKSVTDATAKKVLEACADAAEKLYEKKSKLYAKTTREKGTSEKTPDAGQRPRPTTITKSLSSGIVPPSPTATHRADPLAKLLEKASRRAGRAQA